MDKKALRKEISALKKAMTEEEILSYSKALEELFVSHPLYQEASSIYGYLPYNQEVRTIPMLERALEDGKRVAVPKVVENGTKMIFVWLTDFSTVAPGYCGIPEPLEATPVADDPTALVLMPGLAFDREGHRCGYGGGFYDKFLEAEPQHKTIALCYPFQVLPHLETEPHDKMVDAVLFPSIL